MILISSNVKTAISLARGSAQTVRLTARDTDGTLLNTSGKVFYLAVKKKATDRTPLISRIGVNAVLTTSGVVEFTISTADTIYLLTGLYSYDVRYTYLGESFQIVPASDFTVTVAISLPGDEVTIVEPATVEAYGLPPLTGNAGKVLKVTDDDPEELEWAVDENDEAELPDQTSAAGMILSTDGVNPAWIDAPTDIPDQTGNSGKVLSTDGVDPEWIDSTDGLPDQTGNSGKVLSTDGVDPEWIAQASGNVPSTSGVEAGAVLRNTPADDPQWVHDRVYNILDYGGVGDYNGDINTATDNSPAFAAAVLAMDDALNLNYQAAYQGFELYFPPGIYYFSQTILVNKVLHIRGAGPAATIFKIQSGRHGIRTAWPGLNTPVHMSRSSNITTMRLGARILSAARTSDVTTLNLSGNELGIGGQFFPGFELLVDFQGTDPDFPDYPATAPAIALTTVIDGGGPGVDTVTYADPGPDVSEKDLSATTAACRQGIGPAAEMSLTEFLKPDQLLYFINNGYATFGTEGYRQIKTASEMVITYDDVGADQAEIPKTGYINQGSGLGSTIEGFTFQSEAPNANLLGTYYGFYMNAACTVRNVWTYASGWTYGFYLLGGVPYSHVSHAQLHHCVSQGSVNDGIRIRGGDASIVRVDACDFSFNGTGSGLLPNLGSGNGLSDYSAFGSIIINNHCRENTGFPISFSTSNGNGQQRALAIGNYSEGAVYQGDAGAVVLGGIGSEEPEIGSNLSMTYNTEGGWNLGNGTFQGRRRIAINDLDDYFTGVDDYLATFTDGSDTVTGTNTLWSSGTSVQTVVVGDYVKLVGSPSVSGGIWRRVIDVVSDTELTLEGEYGRGWYIYNVAPFDTYDDSGTGVLQRKRATGLQYDGWVKVPNVGNPTDMLQLRVGVKGGFAGALTSPIDTDTWSLKYAPPVIGGLTQLGAGWFGMTNPTTGITAFGWSTRNAVEGVGVFCAPQGIVLGDNASTPQSYHTVHPLSKNAGPASPTRTTITSYDRTNTDGAITGTSFVFENGSDEVVVITGSADSLISAVSDRIKLTGDDDSAYAMIDIVEDYGLMGANSGLGAKAKITLSAPYTGTGGTGTVSRSRGYVTLTCADHELHIKDGVAVVGSADEANFPSGDKIIETFTATSISYYESGPDTTYGVGGVFARRYSAGAVIWNGNPVVSTRSGGSTYNSNTGDALGRVGTQQNRPLAWMCVEGGTAGLWAPVLYLNSNIRDLELTTAPTDVLKRLPVMFVHNNNTASDTENFIVWVSYRVITGATDVDISLGWDNESGAQTKILANTTGDAVGTYNLEPIYINANSDNPIVINATASVNSRVFISATIQPVS